ncbi:MAG: PDZ domain-containing protein [Flavisolibacter sp.]
MIKLSCLFLVTNFLLLCRNIEAQDLPRSASFGAAVTDLNDSTKKALHLSFLSGSQIQRVIPNSSAGKAGFRTDDVLTSMDGENIENTRHFLELLKKHNGGDKVNISFYRRSKLSSTTLILLPKQMETSDNYDIIYSSMVSGTNKLRTIITKPKAIGSYPAVLIIGGVGCYSIDNPSVPEIRSIKMWADSLTTNGFVTIRIEKTGMGDSKGIPCNECDFNTEKQGYLDGLRKLKSLPYVDQQNVFIAGFSIGGVIAPLIAQQEQVKGIIVYGTVGRNWLEYELENTLRQQLLEGKPADSVDQYMRAEYVRLYGLFVEKKQPSQIMKEHPEATPNFFQYPMRTEYFQQVADVNIRELWMNTTAKVLALHGAADFVSSSADHKVIAETVNHYHPGNAVYFEISNCDHWSLFAESEAVSLKHQGTEVNTLPITTSMKWLRSIL